MLGIGLTGILRALDEFSGNSLREFLIGHK